MDTLAVIARFEAERQALAMMDHPNIAKVFDAGATDKGRPFLVMELVRGIPITAFCDAKPLGTRERLTLFGQVCSAITHAHQKGVIHRDIEPGGLRALRSAGHRRPGCGPCRGRCAGWCHRPHASPRSGSRCLGHGHATGAVLPELELTDLFQINDAAWLGGGRLAGLVTARYQRSDPCSEEWLVLWDAAPGRCLLHLPNSSRMNRLAATPGGHRLAGAGLDKMIRIRDATTLEVVHEFRAHDDSITAFAWHPDRPLLASASADLTVKIWNPDTGECLEELHGFVNNPTTLQFSPTGRIWEPNSLR